MSYSQKGRGDENRQDVAMQIKEAERILQDLLELLSEKPPAARGEAQHENN